MCVKSSLFQLVVFKKIIGYIDICGLSLLQVYDLVEGSAYSVCSLSCSACVVGSTSAAQSERVETGH